MPHRTEPPVPSPLDRPAQAPPDDADAAPATLVAPAPAPVEDPTRESWFDALFRQHATAVHRYLVRRGAGDDAEDLAADVLTVAWRRREDVPSGMELAWLYRTAAFVLANYRRRTRAVPVAEVPDLPDDADPALRAVQDERVREVLAALLPRDREILLLNAWDGIAGDDLAAVLGISRGGADAALSRARARLTAAWAGTDADGGGASPAADGT